MTDDISISSRSRWMFPSTHPDYLSKDVLLDLSDLALGKIKPYPASAHNWVGAYTGRPGLLADLMPSLQAAVQGKQLNRFTGLKGSLVSLWRFLDAYEAMLADRGAPYQRVDRLHHLTGVHMSLYTMPGPDGCWKAPHDTIAKDLLRLIRDAVLSDELPEIAIPAIHRSSRPRKDTPGDEEAKALLRFVRAKVLAIFARWKRADGLASLGRNLLDLPRRLKCGVSAFEFTPTEADAHATYRALVQRTNHPVCRIADLSLALNSQCSKPEYPSWWPKYSGNCPADRENGQLVGMDDLVAGLYPTSADVAILQLMFLGRSAWNPATVCSLDVSNNASWKSSYDDNHQWLFAMKLRSGSYQNLVSRTADITGCYSLVLRLIERNCALRAWVATHPEVNRLSELAVRSPWVGVSLKRAEYVYVASTQTTATTNIYLARLIKEHNSHPTSTRQVPMMTASDFRDIAAAAIYRDSGYSAWVLMLLLGHKNLATTFRYGFRRAGLEESHSAVVKVTNELFEQIECHKKIDWAVLRANVEGMQISHGAMARLEAARRNRTYDGSGCTDPSHPPQEIDPTHPQDGHTICVQQHRCAGGGCPNARVFNDSLSLLCRRVAELECNSRTIGTVRFHTGSDAEELQRLRATLTQWPKSQVQAQMETWRGKIERGEHQPFYFGGQH